MIKELICIICPMGCHLQIEMDDMKNINLVTGNSCPRGEKYACKELIHPERILTDICSCITYIFYYDVFIFDWSFYPYFF